MANRNSFCVRFIHYAAVLTLLLFSTFSNAFSFGGAGANGEWGEPPQTCQPQKLYQKVYGDRALVPTIQQACPTSYQAFSNGSLWLRSPPYTFHADGTAVCHYTNDIHNYDKTAHFLPNSAYDPNCQNQCPVGYEKDSSGKCQPKKCPVGESLVNGQCKPKQCQLGTMLDLNGNCLPPDDSCPIGQESVNGQCRPKTCPSGYELQGSQCVRIPDQECAASDPSCTAGGFELPPFCEWADVMCKWYEDWAQWSNDYNRNEEKANMDREELKRLSLDSKEYLNEIKINLGDIKQQDQQFYDELRLWLQNFDPENGTPSDQNPSIEFPVFCDWSVQVCNWHLDWQDWRNDYNAHNAAVLQKFNDNLSKLEEIKQNDIQHHADSNEFYDDVRDFFGWYKNQEQSDPNDPNDPENPANQDGNVAVEQQIIPLDETQRITFVNGCPASEQFNVSFMGQSQNIEFSYQPLCQFMSLIRPFVIAIAYLIGAYILMGLSRGSSE